MIFIIGHHLILFCYLLSSRYHLASEPLLEYRLRDTRHYGVEYGSGISGILPWQQLSAICDLRLEHTPVPIRIWKPIAILASQLVQGVVEKSVELLAANPILNSAKSSTDFPTPPVHQYRVH